MTDAPIAILRSDRREKVDQPRTTRKYEVTQVESVFEIPYPEFTAAFESLLGRMELGLADLPSLSPEAARARLASFVGPLDFTLFQKIDHGAVVAVLYGRKTRAVTYVFGNALIAVEMTKHDARAGLYVPLRLFAEELVGDRVRITYDLPSSLIAPLGSAGADPIARDLDKKVEHLLAETSKRSRRS